uniref:Uncharacterized protein n=1 Tax=Daphnia galeata TaxID=27404 RepID=A0A8J2WNH8_9CRUS|nr:unnamed protein product [Daphnia galeata]
MQKYFFVCRFAKQKAQIYKQEKELQVTMGKLLEELKIGEIEIVKLEIMAADFFARLGDGFRQLLEESRNLSYPAGTYQRSDSQTEFQIICNFLKKSSS